MQMFEMKKQHEEKILDLEGAVREIEEVLVSRDQTLQEARRELERFHKENVETTKELRKSLSQTLEEVISSAFDFLQFILFSSYQRSMAVHLLEERVLECEQEQDRLREKCSDLHREMALKSPFNDTRDHQCNSLNLSSHGGLYFEDDSESRISTMSNI